MGKKSSQTRIGQRIQQLRKDKKLSQAMLAELIDKSTETISHIEREIFLPRLETAQEIANVLDVHLYELFIHEFAEVEKVRIKLVHEIVKLLKDQPTDLLKTTLDQVKGFVALKESFAKLKK
jgi:DNA-binding XRE family transcriptional regulator